MEAINFWELVSVETLVLYLYEGYHGNYCKLPRQGAILEHANEHPKFNSVVALWPSPRLVTVHRP